MSSKANGSTGERQSKALKRIGLLEVVDPSFVIGQRSKLYRACGELELICAALAEQFKREPQELPTYVEDGTWHHTLLEVAPYFYRDNKNLKGYREWFRSLPGHDLGDRPGQMSSIWDWFERKWK